MCVAPSRAGMEERVGEHEPALRVRVVISIVVPFGGADDVARSLACRRGMFSQAGTTASDADRQLELRDRSERGEDGGAAAPCRTSCPPCDAAGLSERPPESNVMPLPTMPSTSSALAGVPGS